ncbi:MAG: DUF6449 domain-containing protein [Bacillota bacterium]
MTSKTSFFNKGIFVDNIRRFSILGILNTMLLLWYIPMQILLMNSRNHIYPDNVQRMLAYEAPDMKSLIVILVPIIISVMLFRYINIKASADVVHSFPIKRSVLYRTHLFTGALLLLVPILITGISLFLLNTALNLEDFYGFSGIAAWMLNTVLIQLVIYLAGNAIGMLCGLSIVQGVLTFIFLVLPAGLIEIIKANAGALIYGYTGYGNIAAYKFSPITRLIDGFYVSMYHDNSMTAAERIVYILLCIALIISGEILYKRRHIEGASEPIIYKKLHPLIKYGAAFCTMILAGSIFYETQGRIGWLYFGYITGSLAGYFISEMILKKTWKVFKSIKGFCIYAAAAVVLVLIINLDPTGFEKRIPAVKDIESVYFSEHIHAPFDRMEYYLKDNIINVHKLHEHIINNKEYNRNKVNKLKRDTVTIAYRMKNGKEMVRSYYIEKEKHKEFLKPIFESQEHKLLYNKILELDPKRVEKLVIESNFIYRKSKSVTLIKPDEVKEALEILKEEILGAAYEDMNESIVPWAGIKVVLSDSKEEDTEKYLYNTVWRKSYVKFAQWLMDKGYYEKARVLPEEIDMIAIKRDSEGNKGFTFSTEELKSEHILKVTDKKQIEQCLVNYNTGWYSDKSEYQVVFLEGDYDVIGMGSFFADTVPDFVREFFKK